jgi:hypothetical protein
VIGMNRVSLHRVFAFSDGVLPNSVAGDLRDGALRNLIMIGEGLQRRAAFALVPDCDGIGVGEFRVGMLCALESKFSTEHIPCVKRIASHRRVLQILGAIASRIAVFVIHHFADFRRPDEGEHHELMHRSPFLSPICTELHAQMAGSSSIHRQQPRRVVIDAIAPRRNLLHSAMRTYFIQTLETRHWKPLLGSHALEGAR